MLDGIAQNADDDQVQACAVKAHTHLTDAGDQHLHSLGGNYQSVRIVTPAKAAVDFYSLVAIGFVAGCAPAS